MVTPKELIYGYLGNFSDVGTIGGISNVMANLKVNNADGLFMIDASMNSGTATIAKMVRDAGMDFILGFRWPHNVRDIGERDWDMLSRALSITNRLALGNCATQEWYGGANRSPLPGRKHAQVYQRIAKRHDFEWVCTITHRTICIDIKDDGVLKAQLGPDTLCACLCGYILMGYCYGDVRMPHQCTTSLKKQNLYERYGLTADTLKWWLSDMNCLTGAGYQPGLDGGIRPYAKEVGFKGIISGMPFHLEGTEDVPILQPMKTLPKRCGMFDDYQNREGQ